MVKLDALKEALEKIIKKPWKIELKNDEPTFLDCAKKMGVYLG